MANEVMVASRSEGSRAISNLVESVSRLRAARVRIFETRKTLGLTSADAETPAAPELEFTDEGFFRQLNETILGLDQLTREIGGDIDAIAAAFK